VTAPVLLAVGLLAAAVGLQHVRERSPLDRPDAGAYLYLPSGDLIARAALSYDALVADVYWIRAIQHYGGTKRSSDPEKKFALLHPLLDITTTLDPQFNIAYRFGAIFLAEPFPGGPGRPDQAIALLEKGIAANPGKWQYYQDIGFVHYWWRRDFTAAAQWFARASQVEGAPWWLRTLAATTLARGGDRRSSRLLWEELGRTPDNDWLQRESQRRLLQLDALDELDRLARIVGDYVRRHGAPPDGWRALVPDGYLRGEPVDPAGVPYRYDPREGSFRLAPDSPLFPLPTEPGPLPRPAT
jgi:hypothetical protein